MSLINPFVKGALRYYTCLGAPEPRARLPLQEVPGDPVIGSMSRHWEAWRALGAPRLLYQWLRGGVSIHWNGPAPQAQMEDCTKKQNKEIKKEMKQLVKDGAFSFTRESDVRVAPVFLIPKRSGGKRLIHDLRSINAHIQAPHFTLRGVKDASAVVTDSNWLCSLDLRRGYQQVYMAPEARKFLGARIGEKTVVSNVLPFGLSLSPYVFTRLTNWVAGVLRRKTGLKIGVYIDDFIVGSETKEQLEDGLKIIREVFNKLGIILSDKKPVVIAKQVEHLGFLWSAEHKTIGITEERRREYRRKIKNLLRTQQPVERWKSVVGKLIFLKEAIGPTLRHVRSILRLLRGKRAGTRITPTQEVVEDLTWWLDTLREKRELSLLQKEVKASITTDASDVAVGYVLEKGNTRIERSLDVENIEASINARELEALLRCLENHGDILEGMRVLWYTDSMSARAAVMRQGTQNLSIQTWNIAKTILDIMEKRQIKIIVKHVPGALNRLADALSRPGQVEDKWEEALKTIVSNWGPMQFDPYGFARASTGPVEDMKWSEGRALLKPPVVKLPELLELLKLKIDLGTRKNPPSLWECCAIVITPTWKQSLWWNQLVEMRRDWLDLGQIPEKTFKGWEIRNSHPPSWTASLIAMQEPCGHLTHERNTSESYVDS